MCVRACGAITWITRRSLWDDSIVCITQRRHTHTHTFFSLFKTLNEWYHNLLCEIKMNDWHLNHKRFTFLLHDAITNTRINIRKTKQIQHTHLFTSCSTHTHTLNVWPHPILSMFLLLLFFFYSIVIVLCSCSCSYVCTHAFAAQRETHSFNNVPNSTLNKTVGSFFNGTGRLCITIQCKNVDGQQTNQCSQ